MTALATTERDRLAQLEAIVQRGLDTFIDVGNALGEIRDQKLYRETHNTFENYCKQRWGFNDSRARQLIGAAETVTRVTVNGLPAPASERVARELAPLKDDQTELLAAWNEAQAEAAELGTQLTAQVVRNATRKRLARIRREQEAEHADITALPSSPDGARIEHCDIRELHVEPGSIDLTFTDPPYTADTIECYDHLADSQQVPCAPGRC